MIVLTVGPLGVGKSGFTTALAVARARKHQSILASNILLRPPAGVDFVHLPLGSAGIDIDALLELRDRVKAEPSLCSCKLCKRSPGRRVVLVIDEAGIVMDNRFWMDAPPIVKWFFKHSRKLKVDVYLTAHDAEEVDVALRRLVSFTYALRRIPGGGEDGDDRMPWLLVTRRYEGAEAGNRKKMLGWPRVRRWRREWGSWFDSDEIVEVPEAYTRRARRRAEREPGRRSGLVVVGE